MIRPWLLAIALVGCTTAQGPQGLSRSMTVQERAVLRISERYGHDCMVSHDNYGKTTVGLWCPDRKTNKDRVWYIYPDGTVERVR